MNLVVQGAQAQAAHAAEIARLAGAREAEQIAAKAFRLRGAQDNPAVRERCRELGLDCAVVAAGRRLADLKLLAMDMDSTLITIECIDELGDMLGRKAEISAITARAMRGQIDYPESLRQRVALLAGLHLEALEQVYRERLRLSPGAEALVAACRRHGVKLLLVSGGFSFFTDRLKQRLGLDYTIANALELDGDRLTGGLVGRIVDADAKAARFREVAHALGAAREQTVAIGDGANDLKMMAEAGLSVAYRAKPVVKAQAHCALDFSGLDGVLHLFE
ncbi:MAG: phosphoserine phosphatase SerB [Betaproteobacteria bacterium]|nr:phosphoserine phosphatase SerB [Betaproteobacteria bacterium]MDH5222641.1 phosphoserine phosphatase SerB [Betaproteobacteria bacterium]MDH5350378.1 phosphoserine phosphatase SerB [Betaproteobacteria bacterium]